MKYYILIFILLLASIIHAEEFKIREKKFYGGESLELQTVQTGGATIARVFELTEPNDNEIYIRVLSPLSDNVGCDIMTFYQQHYPNELKIAVDSSGNLHNPKLEGLITYFGEAFKSTAFFKEFDKTLYAYGYKVDKIDFEKFSIYLGRVNVAEITLYCSKGK